MMKQHGAVVLFLSLGLAACATQSGDAGSSGGSGAGGQTSPGSGGSAPATGSGGSSSGSGGATGGSSGGSSGGSTGTGTGGSVIDPGTGGSAPASGGSTGSGTEDGGAASGGTTGGAGGSGPPATPPGMAEPESLYTCTHLIGINATEEWYSAGFENIVENAKWQIVRVHSGFVDLWAQPGASVWNTGVNSPCAMNSKTPDRVIFVGLKFEWTDKKMWVDALTAVVKNLKDKFPGIKRIELATFVRGPGDKPCGNAPAYRSTIHPSEDEAIAEVVATDPQLLRASPKFEVTACSDFSGNPPHFAGAGAKNVATLVGNYYAGKSK
jgi:hypothetical protein